LIASFRTSRSRGIHRAFGVVSVPTEDDRIQPKQTQCGNYILGDRIAAGGMAEVFHAEPAVGKFDGPIVLKQMLPALAQSKDFVALFIDEARISTRLDHPNIVQVHDFEATDRGLFIVMELVDGPDLLAVLARCAKLKRYIEPELACYVAAHVLEALDYAHGAALPSGERLNIVHRDVSPSNILITRRGRVKLADFGIARATSLGRTEEVAAGTLKGKFGYMSPEQIRGDHLDGRSDVFSMGIVLAEMLMGKRLFTAPTDVELLLMVRRADLSRLDEYGAHIPDELDAIVRQALSVDRDYRFPTASAFRDALVDWLSDSQSRTGAGRLAELLRLLEREGGDLCTWSRCGQAQKSAGTMSGTQTVLARRSAEDAAMVARLAFSHAAVDPDRRAPTAEDVTLAPFNASDTPAPLPPRTKSQTEGCPLHAGELENVTVVDLLCEIAREQRTGALTLRSGDHYKEAYFRAGQPVFVRCNVLEDRFGEFLVRRNVITRDQLERTLTVLDYFNGRLGQALVSLKLLQPVDAVRLLAAQVAGKLVSASAWHTGSYEFRDGEENPWPALALELQLPPIIGRSLSNIPIKRLGAWADRVRDRPAHLDLERTRAFELEPSTYHRLEALGAGRYTLREVTDALSSPSERFLVAAAAYVLWRCGALRLPSGRADV
jgi:serine/threonine-protein kinase